jgi:hypothetical protein
MDANNYVFCVLWLVSRTLRFFFFSLFLCQCYRVGMVKNLDIMRRSVIAGMGYKARRCDMGPDPCGFEWCAKNTFFFLKPPNG